MIARSRLSDRRAVLTRVVVAATGVVAFIAFSVTIPYFLTVDNLANLLNDVALVGIVAVPATFLMMSGQVDLSVGAAAAFVGIVLARTAPDSGMLPAVLLAVGTGALIGLVNGLLVTEGEVNSIAATFASMALLRGLAYLVPSGLAIALPGFRSLGTLRPVLGIALPTLIFAAVALAAAPTDRSTWPLIIRNVAGMATMPTRATSLSRLARLSTVRKYGMVTVNAMKATTPDRASTTRVRTACRSGGLECAVIEPDNR